MVVCDQQNYVCKMWIEPLYYSFDKILLTVVCEVFSSAATALQYNRVLIEQTETGKKKVDLKSAAHSAFL